MGTMDMSDPQVQAMLEADKQAALARIRADKETYPCPTSNEHEVWNNSECDVAWSGARPMRVRDLKAMLEAGPFVNGELDDKIVCFATEDSYVHVTSVAAPCHDAEDSMGATEGCHEFSAVTLFSFGDSSDLADTLDHVDWRDV